MRKIEFRGKRIDNNEWTYGSLVVLENIDGEKIFSILKSDGTGQHVIEETIGEYTGLKDKNGKEIFEGDVMSISPISPKYEIKWDNEQQRFCFWNDGWIAGFNGFITGYEVIGNIYDNPGLCGAG